MITVKEAIEALRNYQFHSDMCGYYSSDLIELIEHLQSENDKLKEDLAGTRLTLAVSQENRRKLSERFIDQHNEALRFNGINRSDVCLLSFEGIVDWLKKQEDDQ